MFCTGCGNALPPSAICGRCGVPKGITFESSASGFILSSTTRSARALFLVPFLSVWSCASLGGIYGSQLYAGVFDMQRSLFGIPFVLGALILWPIALMSLWGSIVVAREEDAGFILRSVGKVGWTQRFQWSDVQAVAEANAAYGPKGGPPYQVVAIKLKSNKRLKFGSVLSDKRRAFIISALNAQLLRLAR